MWNWASSSQLTLGGRGEHHFPCFHAPFLSLITRTAVWSRRVALKVRPSGSFLFFPPLLILIKSSGLWLGPWNPKVPPRSHRVWKSAEFSRSQTCCNFGGRLLVSAFLEGLQRGGCSDYSLCAVSRERAFKRPRRVADAAVLRTRQTATRLAFLRALFCGEKLWFVHLNMAAYTLPEGFTEFDMFTFGTALLVGGKWAERHRKTSVRQN